MSTDENKAIMRRFIEAVFNEKRLDRAEELVAPDYLDHGALPSQAPGIEGAKQRWAMFNAAIPDMRTTIEDLVAEGDKVVVRYTAEGTQQGEMMGIPPTGKRFRMTGINITRMAGGKLAEHWAEMDMLGMMQQLGVIPAPAQTG
ncbi:MAG: ester cyclase [Dehalococcoidia bacterium]